MDITNAEKQKLFTQFKHSVGAPLRDIEITDEQLCTMLEMAIEDYASYVQDWLVEQQWQSVIGKEISTTDMAFALSVRSFDYMSQFTYAYSKQVGLATNGPWELKKDYIEIEAGRQHYIIPKGREVNEVLWVTPSSVDAALAVNYGGFDMGFGGGFAQMGTGMNGGNAGMTGGYYVAPAYDVLLAAQDINLKNRMLRSELVYKITAGPDGTRILHLISTPGSKMSFGAGSSRVEPNALSNRGNLTGCRVWYHYYDTTSANVDECRKDNPDIIKLPNEVPLSKLEYSSFNESTKTLVRQLFIALAKTVLGRTRGKFLGVTGMGNAMRTMDWESMLAEGNNDKKEILARLDERLLRLSSEKQIERAANEAENLNRHLKFRPLKIYVK